MAAATTFTYGCTNRGQTTFHPLLTHKWRDGILPPESGMAVSNNAFPNDNPRLIWHTHEPPFPFSLSWRFVSLYDEPHCDDRAQWDRLSLGRKVQPCRNKRQAYELGAGQKFYGKIATSYFSGIDKNIHQKTQGILSTNVVLKKYLCQVL